MEIRNIAIIAHVDHGKTSLTDGLMRQAGLALEGATMDSNVLELGLKPILVINKIDKPPRLGAW